MCSKCVTFYANRCRVKKNDRNVDGIIAWRLRTNFMQNKRLRLACDPQFEYSMRQTFNSTNPIGGIPLKSPKKGRRKGMKAEFSLRLANTFLAIYNPDPDIMMMTRGTEKNPSQHHRMALCSKINEVNTNKGKEFPYFRSEMDSSHHAT